MLGSVGAEEFAFAPDLDGVASERDLDLTASERIADAVVRAGETHPAVVPDLADNHPVGGRSRRCRGERPPQHALLLLGEVSPRVGGDEHALVEDLDEAVVADELDRLPGEVAADVVLEVQQAHLPVDEHATHEPGRD